MVISMNKRKQNFFVHIIILTISLISCFSIFNNKLSYTQYLLLLGLSILIMLFGLFVLKKKFNETFKREIVYCILFSIMILISLINFLGNI